MTHTGRQLTRITLAAILGGMMLLAGPAVPSETVKSTNAARTGCKLVRVSPRRVLCTIDIAGTIRGSTLSALIRRQSRQASVIVRRRAGSRATVAGSITVGRPRVTLAGLRITGQVQFMPGARFGRLIGSSARAFEILGPDDVRIIRNRFDGQGRTSMNIIEDGPGSVPQRFVIAKNVFRRFYGPRPSDHSEALFIGYSNGGRIQGNTFSDNGTTSHIFFTWWGTVANSRYSYPRNICVRANRFGATHGGYYDVNFREEIPRGVNIRIDPGQRATSSNRSFVRRCP